jgi:3-hydroxyacyl-[acyl-carrier-protein] dehydratase
MRKDSWLIELGQWDTDDVVADLNAIRQYNPQRLEMEQLTAVIYEDATRHACLGYKDLAMDEFWVHGSVSRNPVMPGTLMCEAAAQLANYYALKHKLYMSPGVFLGLRNVRFREGARPGERLFIMVKLLKVRGALLTCRFQCVARERLVCDGILIGGTSHSVVFGRSVGGAGPGV